ncbi:electron transport complex subunit RsxG [Vreelandella zhaodongensis]|jgi:electron transport complex protein RnfG|uniref:Ion-translocating oxidoreductase complex subunit G n=1 Tax=Vreelandella zhaodongensis TaxID=1176240 RepID=A0ABX2SQG8_VREZH|nr:electron transport complex subunit RsxG [Halomonas zhaodongensis]NYS43799.1 electron transport complex subunit RsxG [Halomonas zhaodongensis]
MTPRQAMLRGAFALGVFSLVTAGSVALTRAVTAERIAAHQQAYQHRQLQEVLPAPFVDIAVQTVLESSFELPSPEQLGHQASQRDSQRGWHVQSGTRSVIILPVVTRQGYNGEIQLLVGIDQQQRITGVRVTQHQETPGLGDDIERQRSDWITNFNGLGLNSLPPNGWAVRKDGGHFDAFTGATITPRAVVNAVHRALNYVADTDLPITFEEPSP